LKESRADGVMVGRGAQGRPWRLAQIAHDLYASPTPVVPVENAFSDIVSAHYEAMLTFYGTRLGLRVARKHLGWYMDHAGTPSTLRRLILTAQQPADVLRLLPEALATNWQVAA